MVDIIITFCISFAFGWVARELYAKYLIAKFLIHVEGSVKEEIEERVTRIIIEKQNGRYFVYSAHDKSFMAQGDSRSQVEDNLAQRYPGKFFAATPDNLKEMGFDK